MSGKAVSTPKGQGASVTMHRALASLHFPPARLLVLLWLPAAFTLGLWFSRHGILALWQAMFSFWTARLTPEVGVLVSTATLGLPLSYPTAQAPLPDSLTWSLTLVGSVVAWLLASGLPEHLLPLRYFIRMASFIQLTALAFFALWPTAFPYSLPGYSRSLLETGVWLLILLPWTHALVYYVFDFALWRKILLTAMTLGFLVVAIPLQVMAHVCLITGGSLLQLPLLYLLFGIWPLIFACVGLYGWAMSWTHPPVGESLPWELEEEGRSAPAGARAAWFGRSR